MTGTEGGSGLFARLRRSLAGGDAKGEEWPLLVHGKLPIYKDFISSGVTEEAAKEFRDWLGNGFSHIWSPREEYKACEIPPTRFLGLLPRTRRLVAGALWGSHDEGGLRRFPFALFSVVPGGRALEPFVALDALEGFDAKGAAIRRNWDTPGTLSAFYAAHRGAGVKVVFRSAGKLESEVRGAISAYTVDDYAAALQGQSHSPGAFDLWLERVRDAFEKARTGRVGAVVLPLTDIEAPVLQAQFWLLFASAVGRSAPTGFLLSQPREAPPRVVFFWRALHPEDVLLLHPALCEAEDAVVVAATADVAVPAQDPPGVPSPEAEPGGEARPVPPVVRTLPLGALLPAVGSPGRVTPL